MESRVVKQYWYCPAFVNIDIIPQWRKLAETSVPRRTLVCNFIQVKTPHLLAMIYRTAISAVSFYIYILMVPIADRN